MWYWCSIKMIGYILTLLIFVVLSDCTVDNQGILLEISSGQNVCNHDKLFRNFKFSDTPELSAMCNIPFPKETQVNILLENNVIPILCMGVYDVSLRLCSEAANDTLYFKDLFPASAEKFTGIFKELKNNAEYSYLNKFCSETVGLITHKKVESAGNSTKLWWEMLINKLNNENSCMAICRTNEINQVHPLCSYIIWSNGIIRNHQNSLAQSEEKDIQAPVVTLTDKNEVKSDSAKPVEDQGLYESSNGEQSLISELKTTSSASPPSAVQKPIQQELNSTKQATVIVPGKDELSVVPSEEKQVSTLVTESTKSALNTSSNVISSNNITLSQSVSSKDKPTKTDDKQNENEFLPDKEMNLNSVGSDMPVQSNTDSENKDQMKPIQVAEDPDQNDFNGEIDLDNIPSDQPNGSDPKTQQQIEEELEDADDDEGIVGENPIKEDSKKSDDTVNKQSLHNEQGKPDEVYSEVDRAVLLDPFVEAEDTHFFSYFLFMSVLTIVAYLAFHNKNKILALAVEGRRTKSSRRRPNSSNYSKLDCSLEEAMVSNTTASVTHVLY